MPHYEKISDALDLTLRESKPVRVSPRSLSAISLRFELQILSKLLWGLRYRRAVVKKINWRNRLSTADGFRSPFSSRAAFVWWSHRLQGSPRFLNHALWHWDEWGPWLRRGCLWARRWSSPEQMTALNIFFTTSQIDSRTTKKSSKVLTPDQLPTNSLETEKDK